MLKLVKTNGSSNGAPNECNRCASVDFQRSRLAWHCISCGNYVPTELGFETIKSQLLHAQNLMKSFKLAVNDLERIVGDYHDIDSKR